MSKAIADMRAMLAKRDKLVAIGVDLDEGGTGVFVEYTRKLLAVAEAAEALHIAAKELQRYDESRHHYDDVDEIAMSTRADAVYKANQVLAEALAKLEGE